MIVSQFQSWAETASPPGRADGVNALARALLYSSLDPEESQAAVLALAGFLDDPSPLVRLALADAFASAIDAPRAIVLALVDDDPAIASIVLSRSPILSDADLVDCVATGGGGAQTAIALRPFVSAPVAAALAEAGSAEALSVLAENLDADIPDFAIKRMLERHGDHAGLRAALIARGGLPIEARFELMAAEARETMPCAAGRGRAADGRLERLSREAAERAAIAAAASDDSGEESAGHDDLRALAAHLRQSGRLTAGFAFRIVLSGNLAFFNAVLHDLSGMPATRVEGLTRACYSTGFAALYRKSGLPPALLPAYRIALSAVAGWESGGGGLCLPLVVHVHDQCMAINDGALDKLLVMLRRFEAEAIRDEARTQKAAIPAVVPALASSAFLAETERSPEAGEDHLAGEDVWSAPQPAAPRVETAGPVAESTPEAGNGIVLETKPEEPLEHIEGFDTQLFFEALIAVEAPEPEVESEVEAVPAIEEPMTSRVDVEDEAGMGPYQVWPELSAPDPVPLKRTAPPRVKPWVNIEADLAGFEAELFAA